MPVRALHRPRTAIRAFLHSEAAGGVVLIAAAALALLVANSPLSGAYFTLLHADIGPMSLMHWINDGAMAVFFFLVGLEIKREWLDGHLSRWPERVLPGIAALAGMVVPALIYLRVAGSDPALIRGWAIPAATDIAFAIGVLALLGHRAPSSLKLLLTSVAIIDDMGAVAIIALAYTATISGVALLVAAVIFGLMMAMNRTGVRTIWPYLLGFAGMWLAVLASGVHATIAGVVAAFAVPISVTPTTPEAENSTLHRLEKALHPWVAFGIVPLFGFANAGVSLEWAAGEIGPLPLGIAGGLFLGKQFGVFAAIRAAVALGIAQRPAHASWTQVYGVALLCGIGFTMSLFIGGLAFADAAHQDAVKIGVLMGSAASALAGWLVLRFAARQ